MAKKPNRPPRPQNSTSKKPNRFSPKSKKPKNTEEEEDKNNPGKKTPRSKYLKRLQGQNRLVTVQSHGRQDLRPKKEGYSKKIDKNNEVNARIRLNKFIADAGVCSRREADKLIAQGFITVNGQKITELGYRVKSDDIVHYKNRRLNRENLVYVLLNKPKDFITTTSDPQERKTVLQLVATACKERIYPVGRLDRSTTGLLLLTNDGDLAQKMAHPSFEISKIYQVELDKPITKEDFEKVLQGVELEDGLAPVDEAYVLDKQKNTLGVRLHLGRNRIIRRIFAHLGYDVKRLDRTMYAGLTKKDLPRGKWRNLTEEEIIRLKYFM